MALTERGGPLVPLSIPVRVFDSRVESPLPGHRKFDSETVHVNISHPGISDFAAAVLLNVTITETEGAGYLVVYASDFSGDSPEPATSNINWWTSGLTLANLAFTLVGAESGVAVRCGGGGRTHVVLDLCGYVPLSD